MKKETPFEQRPPEYDLDFSQNPHDRYFRFVMQYVQVVEQIVQCFLPKEHQNALDLSTLEQSSDSYLDEQMREHFSDTCYTVMLKEEYRQAKRRRGKGVLA